MALTITDLTKGNAGDRRRHTALIDFDSSYPTGGEDLTPENLGLHNIDILIAEPKHGYHFVYDYSADKLKVFKNQSSGVVNVDLTAVGNVGTGTDDLITYALPASTLETTGGGVRITAWGSTANTAETKTVTLNFGSVAILSTALTASIAGAWRIAAEVFRTGVDTQNSIATVTQGATSLADTEFTALTQDEDAAITIKCTAAVQTTTDGIIQEGLLVEYLHPPGTGGSGFEVLPTTSLAGLTDVRVIAYGI